MKKQTNVRLDENVISTIQDLIKHGYGNDKTEIIEKGIRSLDMIEYLIRTGVETFSIKDLKKYIG